MNQVPLQETASGHHCFPTTHWSAIVAAGDTLSEDSLTALNDLCRAYWSPLYAYVRRAGNAPHDAQDLVQGFLASLIARSDLGQVAPEKGRFRTFLLVGLRNFTIKQALRNKARKRGAGQALLSINLEEAERLCGPDLSCATPEVAFDRRWARTILERSYVRLREEHEARRRTELFDVLSPFLDGGGTAEYEEAATRLGMKRGAVAVAVHRLRLRLRELVRTEVAQTLSCGDVLEAELKQLFDIWTQ